MQKLKRKTNTDKSNHFTYRSNILLFLRQLLSTLPSCYQNLPLKPRSSQTRLRIANQRRRKTFGPWSIRFHPKLSTPSPLPYTLTPSPPPHAVPSPFSTFSSLDYPQEHAHHVPTPTTPSDQHRTPQNNQHLWQALSDRASSCAFTANAERCCSSAPEASRAERVVCIVFYS